MGIGFYHRILSLVQNMQTLGQLFEPLYVVPCYFMSIATAGMPFPRCFYLHDTIFTYFTLLLLGTVLGMPGL